MNLSDATRLMQRYLNSLNASRVTYWDGQQPPELVLVPEPPLERPYGWVFFYQSRDYVETGEFSAMVVGHGPGIVCRDGREVHVMGSLETLEAYERGEASYEVISFPPDHTS